MSKKPEPDTKEQKLLNRIFDDATSDAERAKAIKLLKKEAGKDRAGLVEKYTKPSENRASNGAKDSTGKFWSDCYSAELKLRLEAEGKLRVAEEKASRYWSSWCDSSGAVIGFRQSTRRLAAIAGVKDSRLDGGDDEVCKALDEMIDGPVREAIRLTTASPDMRPVMSALCKLLADGGKTAGEILAAIDKQPKLRQALTKGDYTFRDGKISAIKLGLYLKDAEGGVFDGMRLVGRRDEHRKQIIWFAEDVAGGRG